MHFTSLIKSYCYWDSGIDNSIDVTIRIHGPITRRSETTTNPVLISHVINIINNNSNNNNNISIIPAEYEEIRTIIAAAVIALEWKGNLVDAPPPSSGMVEGVRIIVSTTAAIIHTSGAKVRPSGATMSTSRRQSEPWYLAESSSSGAAAQTFPNGHVSLPAATNDDHHKDGMDKRQASIHNNNKNSNPNVHRTSEGNVTPAAAQTVEKGDAVRSSNNNKARYEFANGDKAQRLGYNKSNTDNLHSIRSSTTTTTTNLPIIATMTTTNTDALDLAEVSATESSYCQSSPLPVAPPLPPLLSPKSCFSTVSSSCVSVASTTNSSLAKQS